VVSLPNSHSRFSRNKIITPASIVAITFLVLQATAKATNPARVLGPSARLPLLTKMSVKTNEEKIATGRYFKKPRDSNLARNIGSDLGRYVTAAIPRIRIMTSIFPPHLPEGKQRGQISLCSILMAGMRELPKPLPQILPQQCPPMFQHSKPLEL